MKTFRFALSLCVAFSTLPVITVSATEFPLPDPHEYCNRPAILERLKADVDGKYRKYIGEDLFLIDVVHPRLKREVVRSEEFNVGRQFCHAGARMSDGRTRDLWYLLEYPWGFAGQLTRVEFCISGLDPWHVYGKNCSTVR
jgi:hypothetical protein